MCKGNIIAAPQVYMTYFKKERAMGKIIFT